MNPSQQNIFPTPEELNQRIINAEAPELRNRIFNKLHGYDGKPIEIWHLKEHRKLVLNKVKSELEAKGWKVSLGERETDELVHHEPLMEEIWIIEPQS